MHNDLHVTMMCAATRVYSSFFLYVLLTLFIFLKTKKTLAMCTYVIRKQSCEVIA